MDEKEALPVTDKNEIIVYQPEGGEFHIEVRVENETVWLTQAQMAELFGSVPQNITMHIKNIYQEGELLKNPTCKDFLQVAREGNRNVKRCYKCYNLDVIISVGYRVKSIQGTRFRQWANQVLKEHMLKGVNATIYSSHITHAMREEETRLNRQFPTVHLENMREVHDRFVIVDDVVYHVGASFKDLGKQMTAFSVLNFVTKEQVLTLVK